MKEKDLIELGFERSEDQTPEMTGCNYTYHYYTLDFGDDIYDRWCLISNSSDKAKDEGWFVEIFDYSTFKFTNKYQLEKLIETLKYNLVLNEV
jgi:hypothetical protein